MGYMARSLRTVVGLMTMGRREEVVDEDCVGRGVVPVVCKGFQRNDGGGKVQNVVDAFSEPRPFSLAHFAKYVNVPDDATGSLWARAGIHVDGRVHVDIDDAAESTGFLLVLFQEPKPVLDELLVFIEPPRLCSSNKGLLGREVGVFHADGKLGAFLHEIARSLWQSSRTPEI